MKTVPVTIDHTYDLESNLGSLMFASKKTEFIQNLLESGHCFQITPVLENVQYNEAGDTIVKADLVALSVNSITARKVIPNDNQSK